MSLRKNFTCYYGKDTASEANTVGGRFHLCALFSDCSVTEEKYTQSMLPTPN